MTEEERADAAFKEWKHELISKGMWLNSKDPSFNGMMNTEREVWFKRGFLAKRKMTKENESILGKACRLYIERLEESLIFDEIKNKK